jgi:hypothetical protein
MTSIPVVWKKDDKSPPEWVLVEMQGELQFKGVTPRQQWRATELMQASPALDQLA